MPEQPEHELVKALRRVLAQGLADYAGRPYAKELARMYNHDLDALAERIASAVSQWARPSEYEGDPFGPPLDEYSNDRLVASLADERDQVRGERDEARRERDEAVELLRGVVESNDALSAGLPTERNLRRRNEAQIQARAFLARMEGR